MKKRTHSKTINFDFFKLSIVGEDDFAVAKIFSLPASHYKTINGESDPVTLFNKTLKKENGFVLGSLIHNQMYGIPPSLDNESGKLEKLHLSAAQGIAHSTSFIFDEKTNILMLESSRSGVLLGGFCSFFGQNCGCEIESSIVLDPEKLAQYKSLTSITKLEVKIAKVKDGSLFNDKTSSFRQIVKAADDTNTTSLEYILSSGRNDNLNFAKIKDFIADLMRYNRTEEVKKLIVTGKEEGVSRSTPIDLINNKLRVRLSFEISRNADIIFLNLKLNRMLEAYKDIRTSLIRTYGLD